MRILLHYSTTECASGNKRQRLILPAAGRTFGDKKQTMSRDTRCQKKETALLYVLTLA